MPELPEVQTVVNNLSTKMINRYIRNVECPNQYTKVFSNIKLLDFNKNVCNKKIKTIFRQGKYIVFELDTGFISIHLRMTGQLLYNSKYNQKYVSAKFILDKNDFFIFNDIRKFGRIYYSKTLFWLNNKLGFEPLSKNFSKSWLLDNIAKKNRMIKALLFDQAFITGLGNIYIDECLWKSKIHPESIASKIQKKNISVLHQSIKKILTKAIKFQGTTIINFYFGNNSKGNYSENLYIYGRTNKKCKRCKNKISKIFVCQRGTHLCTKCQKKIT